MTYRTRQEIFDIAWTGLKAQRFTQSADEDICRYRGERGAKCALGHCIPDDKYLPEFEGCSLSFWGNEDARIRKAAGISKRDVDFASELQSVHDDNESPKAMQKALRDFAKSHSLTIPA